MKIKKGDNVKIISGKDRGRIGRVIRVIPEEKKIVVEGINMRKKHRRARQQGKKGEIINIPVPVHISNCMVVCPKCAKATRTAYVIHEGRKIRICKKCESEL